MVLDEYGILASAKAIRPGYRAGGSIAVSSRLYHGRGPLAYGQGEVMSAGGDDGGTR